MNDKFIQALEAIDVAGDAMDDLHRYLYNMERRMGATFSEVEMSERFIRNLSEMETVIRNMLKQREEILLRRARLDVEKVSGDNAGALHHSAKS